MKLKDLSVVHDYYSSDSNYTDRDAGNSWETWPDFYSEYGIEITDTDMNLCFRFDIERINDSTIYEGKIFMIHQRKGIYAPHRIMAVCEEDLPSIEKYLKVHWNKIVNIWNPISNMEINHDA